MEYMPAGKSIAHGFNCEWKVEVLNRRCRLGLGRGMLLPPEERYRGGCLKAPYTPDKKSVKWPSLVGHES
jgi:hypothetical protein